MKVPDIKTRLPGPKARAIIDRKTSATRAGLRPRLSVGGEGRARHGHRRRRRQSVSRLHGRHSRRQHRPRASAGGSAPSKSRRVNFSTSAAAIFIMSRWPSFAEKLAALGARQRRQKSFFHQLRHRGRGGRDQARPLSYQAPAYHRVSRRVSRPVFGCAIAHRQPGFAARAVRPAASRRPSRAFWFLPPLSVSSEYGSCAIACVSDLEKILFRHEVRPNEVAAIFVEPVQGEGGYIVPPPEYLPLLQELCRATVFYSWRMRFSQASDAPVRCSPASTGASNRTFSVSLKALPAACRSAR